MTDEGGKEEKKNAPLAEKNIEGGDRVCTLIAQGKENGRMLDAQKKGRDVGEAGGRKSEKRKIPIKKTAWAKKKN